MPLEITHRARLVRAHQRAVAGDVGREDGGQPPFDTRLGHEDRLYPLRLRDQVYGRELGVSIEASMSELDQTRTF